MIEYRDTRASARDHDVSSSYLSFWRPLWRVLPSVVAGCSGRTSRGQPAAYQQTWPLSLVTETGDCAAATGTAAILDLKICRRSTFPISHADTQLQGSGSPPHPRALRWTESDMTLPSSPSGNMPGQYPAAFIWVYRSSLCVDLLTDRWASERSRGRLFFCLDDYWLRVHPSVPL